MSIERDYQDHVESLRARHSPDEAMSQAVGGDFEAMGFLQLQLLIACGLKPDHFLIDVGCGSGRLLQHLPAYLSNGRYLGTDVVPALLEHAKQFCPDTPGWRLETPAGLSISAPDSQADMVCFFSVLTHLRHEESYLYLKDALRVLKPGGAIVFSFLEFTQKPHWLTFETMIVSASTRGPLNQFLSRDAIDAFVEHLDCSLEQYFPGDSLFIPLSRPVTLENGSRFESFGTFGQSACLLRKQ